MAEQVRDDERETTPAGEPSPLGEAGGQRRNCCWRERWLTLVAAAAAGSVSVALRSSALTRSRLACRTRRRPPCRRSQAALATTSRSASATARPRRPSPAPTSTRSARSPRMSPSAAASSRVSDTHAHARDDGTGDRPTERRGARAGPRELDRPRSVGDGAAMDQHGPPKRSGRLDFWRATAVSDRAQLIATASHAAARTTRAAWHGEAGAACTSPKENPTRRIRRRGGQRR